MPSSFIRLYDSKLTTLTGDKFELAAINYSEDEDNIATPPAGHLEGSVLEFIDDKGYNKVHTGTLGDPTTHVSNYPNISIPKPLIYPRQMYIVNDTSGSVDSDFNGELVAGDIIYIKDSSNSPETHSFEVRAIAGDVRTVKDQSGATVNISKCLECDTNSTSQNNVVKVVSKDIDGEEGWESYSTILTSDPGTVARKENPLTDTYIEVGYDDIKAYQEDSNDDLQMIVTFREGLFPPGGHIYLEDITHNGDLNDLIVDASSYTGDQVQIKIEIDSSTAPETFKWRFGDYISSTAPASAYAETQRGLSLQFIPLKFAGGEIKVKWLATTGHHASTENWTFTVYPNNKRVYRNRILELDSIYK
tara:strand:- start:473 stop:1555 length:1083 start_codon:yes stop_codon:yes gene_type:complete